MKASRQPLLYDDIEGNADGHFFIDSAITSRISDLRKFVRRSALPGIAGALMGSETVRFFGDQIFVKEPGTRERTAFHQDATYFEIDGDECCVFWIPVDPVTSEVGGMEYLRGSHLDGKLYQPNVFVSQTTLPGADGPKLPDVEGNLEAYDLISFDVEPGDVIVHHYRTVHGAHGNLSRYQVRRALSVQYCGDDIRVKSRPWAPKQSHLKEPMVDGQPLSEIDFPIIWNRGSAQKAA